MAQTRLRAIDLRFLLPFAPARVRLVGDPPGWKVGLGVAGVPVVDEEADLTIVAAGCIGDAARLDSPNVILLGRRGVRTLRRAGYATRTVLVRSHLFVPLDAPAAQAHTLLSASPRRPLVKRLAVRVALWALRAGVPIAPTAVIATRGGPRQPALLASAADLDVPTTDDWCVLRGGGDDLQRCVWLCFADGEPRTAVKWARVQGNAEPFDRDAEAGLILDGLPDAVSRRAIRHLARLSVDGFEGGAETAAVGQPLQDRLESGSDCRHLVTAIAEWIVELGVATRGPLAPAELARLDSDVVNPWADLGATGRLVDRARSLDGVFQHNDVGTWNILVRGNEFTVVDWESSRRSGLPLWDLLFFLSDAFTAHGSRETEKRIQSLLALHRGESVASEMFFEWVDRAAQAGGVPPDAVGNVALLGWLHHGLAYITRMNRGQRLGVETHKSSERGPLERLGKPWLSDPRLGPGWPAFHEWRARRGVA